MSDRRPRPPDGSSKSNGRNLPGPGIVALSTRRAMDDLPGMTQRRLAAALQLSEGHLSRWLSGERELPMDDLGRIVAVVGPTPAQALLEPEGYTVVPTTAGAAAEFLLEVLDLQGGIGDLSSDTREAASDGIITGPEARQLVGHLRRVQERVGRMLAALAPVVQGDVTHLPVGGASEERGAARGGRSRR